MPEFDELYLKLSLQRALVGSVDRSMIGLTAGLFGKRIHLRAYYEGPITEDQRDRTGTIGTEVIADFPEGFYIE